MEHYYVFQMFQYKLLPDLLLLHIEDRKPIARHACVNVLHITISIGMFQAYLFEIV